MRKLYLRHWNRLGNGDHLLDGLVDGHLHGNVHRMGHRHRLRHRHNLWHVDDLRHGHCLGNVHRLVDYFDDGRLVVAAVATAGHRQA